MKYSLIDYRRYKRDVKELKKKYPNIESDIEDVCESLVANPTNAAPLPQYERKLWKIRIPSRDMHRGKSGGFRLIFYFDENLQTNIYRLMIYAKSKREDLPPSEVLALFKKFMEFLK